MPSRLRAITSVRSCRELHLDVRQGWNFLHTVEGLEKSSNSTPKLVDY
jgi:hypothetical protein